MEGVDGDANSLCVVRRGEIECLAEGGDERAVSGVHRVKRFQHQADTVFGSERNQFLEPVSDALTCSDHIFLAGSEPAHHQEQFLGVQRYCFADGLEVAWAPSSWSTTGLTWRSHDDDPGWTLRVEPWEAVRALYSRRTADELRALPGDGDAEPYVTLIVAHLPLPEQSLGE